MIWSSANLSSLSVALSQDVSPIPCLLACGPLKLWWCSEPKAREICGSALRLRISSRAKTRACLLPADRAITQSRAELCRKLSLFLYYAAIAVDKAKPIKIKSHWRHSSTRSKTDHRLCWTQPSDQKDRLSTWFNNFDCESSVLVACVYAKEWLRREVTFVNDLRFGGRRFSLHSSLASSRKLAR